MRWCAIGLATASLVVVACQRDTASADDPRPVAQQQNHFTPSAAPMHPFDNSAVPPADGRREPAARRRVRDLHDPFSGAPAPTRGYAPGPDLKDPFAVNSAAPKVARPSVTLRDPFTGETIEQPAPRRRSRRRSGRTPDLKDPFRDPPKRSAKKAPPLKDPFAK